MKKVTIVGCGLMGSGLINAAMDAGFDVTIVNRTKAKAEQFIKRGAKYAPTLDEAELSKCIVFNLAGDEATKEVVNASKKSRFNGKTVVYSSTSKPSEVEEVAKLFSETDTLFLDAKIMNYPQDVHPERGYVYYSGSKEAFDENIDLFNAFGKTAYLGEDIRRSGMLDIAMLNIHFGAFASLVEVAAYCLKNNYPVEEMIEETKVLLPILLEGIYRVINNDLASYDGKLKDASVCSVDKQVHSTETMRDAINEDGVNTPFLDKIVELFKTCEDKGLGEKEMVAIISEMI
ncbi:MAG: NAD(P)-binding domain-containing protein [Clostridiales Family XIII bacterium]|nr:NAD(P)-binding domain-containing protein [Clostridia bacterium]MDY3013570.1 NAD(P)-binding domain-containing protein [Clostridiales Family XIII bacterium]